MGAALARVLGRAAWQLAPALWRRIAAVICAAREQVPPVVPPGADVPALVAGY